MGTVGLYNGCVECSHVVAAGVPVAGCMGQWCEEAELGVHVIGTGRTED